MQDLLNEFFHYFSSKRMLLWGTSFALLMIGVMLSRLLAFIVARIAQHSTGPRQAAVLRRLSYYALLAMTWSLVLGRLGFDLKVLLGAAGLDGRRWLRIPNLGIECHQRSVSAGRAPLRDRRLYPDRRNRGRGDLY